MYDNDGRRAQAWLRRHGFADTEPTVLLPHRLWARQEADKRSGMAITAGLVAAAVVLQVASNTVRLTGVAALIVVVLAVRWLGRRQRRAIERGVEAELPSRVTHTVARTTREVLDARFVTAAALLYLGPILLLLGAGGENAARGAVVAAVGIIGVLAVLDAVEVAAIVRRPALAADARSLAIDDALRTEEARTVMTTVLPTAVAFMVLDIGIEASGPAMTAVALVGLVLILMLAAERGRPSRRALPAA